jgi:hypothetical protein
MKKNNFEFERIRQEQLKTFSNRKDWEKRQNSRIDYLVDLILCDSDWRNKKNKLERLIISFLSEHSSDILLTPNGKGVTINDIIQENRIT